MALFTKKEYEIALNRLNKVPVYSNNSLVDCLEGSNAGTKYRKKYPTLFNREYNKAIDDRDMLCFVKGSDED